MTPFGVLEIFYGLSWSEQDREAYATFLKQIGFEFYMYGPKADECLRKNWRVPMTAEESNGYRKMQKTFANQGLQFGMALSPHGLSENLDLAERRKLQDKVKALSDVGLDLLGLFFDDMQSSPDLAKKQLEIVHLVESSTSAKIVFCPSFYCNDPLLDALFGERPPAYLETIGQQLSPAIEVLWTGEAIIAPEITKTQLQRVGEILKRKPFICDNFYADDGPLQCNFLRILPPSGRERDVFAAASNWAFNPMNQAHLSLLVLRAFADYAKKGVSPAQAFEDSIRVLVSAPTADFLFQHHQRFADGGLDAMTEGEKLDMRKLLGGAKGPFEREILHWLDGRYVVDFMAMIEQSCYVGS